LVLPLLKRAGAGKAVHSMWITLWKTAWVAGDIAADGLGITLGKCPRIKLLMGIAVAKKIWGG
jgi:hypothetical protein